MPAFQTQTTQPDSIQAQVNLIAYYSKWGSSRTTQHRTTKPHVARRYHQSQTHATWGIIFSHQVCDNFACFYFFSMFLRRLPQFLNLVQLSIRLLRTSGSCINLYRIKWFNRSFWLSECVCNTLFQHAFCDGTSILGKETKMNCILIKLNDENDEKC